MRKYIHIWKAEIMSSLQYISNIFAGFLGYFIIIFIFLNLWNYIYDDPAELINGYSKSQMIWYVIVTEILWKIYNARQFARQICNDVKGGNIAYNMNKPYSYIGYVISSHLGEGVIKSIIYILVGCILGISILGNIPTHSIWSILMVIISGFFAVVIDAFFIIFISLISFYIEDSTPFYWLYSKMILIFGTMFPIEFFPSAFQGIMKMSPIYVICYGPAKLFVDFDLQSAIHIMIAQVIYILIGYGLCLTIYRKGVRKLNVNGG